MSAKIVFTGGLRHQICDVLPDSPEEAITSRQICERLQMDPVTLDKIGDVSAICGKLARSHIIGRTAAYNGLTGRARQKVLAWWRLP